MTKYLIQSARLGFREWTKDDLLPFAEMNADPMVMEHFPTTLSQKETADFIDRLIAHQAMHGYCYFAVEVLTSGEFIGFIGLAHKAYESSHTPATDIGWRLKSSAWGKGYATEGARRVLAYAFDELKLENLISTCTLQNVKSEWVMQKIGMRFKEDFHHPALSDHPDYEKCKCYEMNRERYAES